ncbi:MAG: hypothetical protein NVS4B3_28690 [Gemmatimonadaceae bacterium]
MCRRTLADYKAHATAFEEAGVNVVWISSDAPGDSASLREQLGLPYALPSDREREVISPWGMLNPAEHDGVAIPTALLIDGQRTVSSTRCAQRLDHRMRMWRADGLRTHRSDGRAGVYDRALAKS